MRSLLWYQYFVLVHTVDVAAVSAYCESRVGSAWIPIGVFGTRTRTKHGMALSKRYQLVLRTAGRLPFAPSKVETKANGHVRDQLHALLDFHAEIGTAAFSITSTFSRQ